ncbi:MAG: hypothetical protein FWC47_15910, partial [Oscillospiraceae bacterium]|nr:hypothetical protein [Oscillospiraceae bacterium]
MGCLYPDYVTKKDFWPRLIDGKDFMSLDYFQGQKIEKASMPIEKSEAFFKQVFTKEEYDELDSYGDLFKWMMYIVREALIDSKYLGN